MQRLKKEDVAKCLNDVLITLESAGASDQGKLMKQQFKLNLKDLREKNSRACDLLILLSLFSQGLSLEEIRLLSILGLVDA